MKVERVSAKPLGKKEAVKYAAYVAAEFYGGKAAELKYLGGGSFGKAVRAAYPDGLQVVIKFLRADGMLLKEVGDLKLLAANCPVKIPGVLFVRGADGIIPVDCYVMENIEGKNAFTAFGMLFPSRKKRLEFADQVTSALHRIHCVSGSGFGDTLSPVCATWLEYYRPFAEEVLSKAEEMYSQGRLPEKVISVMRAAWSRFDEIFSEPVERASLIHGDLNVANIMVGKGYRVSGFIDPLNSMYADREYDLFQFDNLTGKRFYLRETYVRKYGASRNCDIKCAFYGLWNEVYCYIKSGVLINFIMNPLVSNMRRRLSAL